MTQKLEKFGKKLLDKKRGVFVGKWRGKKLEKNKNEVVKSGKTYC